VLKLLDVVKLLVDYPEHGLLRGAVGTVIYEFPASELVYEIEFSNDKGETIVQIALRSEDVALYLEP